MADTIHVVAILPDGKEHFGDLTKLGYGHRQQYDYEGFAFDAVRKHKVNTPRKNPETIQVIVRTITLKDGQPVRSSGATFQVQPPLAPMTDAEFTEEQNELLSQIPEEFRGFVSSKAWEDGHSSGYESVISYAQELVSGLKPCIDNYLKRMGTCK